MEYVAAIILAITGLIALFSKPLWNLFRSLILDDIQDKQTLSKSLDNLREKLDDQERAYYECKIELNQTQANLDTYVELSQQLRNQNERLRSENMRLRKRLDEVNPLP